MQRKTGITPAFFEQINYSACNEDSESELKALKLTDQDRVLCITGSGARPLDLLIAQPKEIVSVDFNPTQNYLLELKIIAYQTLDYENCMAFIGLTPSDTRLQIYSSLSDSLSDEAREFWDKNKKILNNGILYSGTWEKWLRTIAQCRFFRKRALRKLLQSPDLETQLHYWYKHWDSAVWRNFLKVIGNRFLWAKILQEPGALLIASDFCIWKYMYERLNHMASHHLLLKNHFANLIFFGRYEPECILPQHLRPEYFDLIKMNVHRIQPITTSLESVLQNPETGKISAYSLSDFSSYADEAMYQSIWSLIINRSPDGARFCERQFLVKRHPEMISVSIIRDKVLEQELEEKDQSFIYSFCAGEILPETRET